MALAGVCVTADHSQTASLNCEVVLGVCQGLPMPVHTTHRVP
jgi:hypothetical protein